MTFLYVKAAHVIFVITWFAAIFYLGRLLIYIVENTNRADDPNQLVRNQLLLMTKRLLFIIGWPSTILTWVLGLYLLYSYSIWPLWIKLKLIMVILLTIYFISLHLLYKSALVDQLSHSSYQLRLYNEVPTIFLFTIVPLVIVRDALSPIWFSLGLFVLVGLLLLFTRVYKKIRKG